MDSTEELRMSELIQFVRKSSPYYARHYTKVPEDACSLSQVPLVDHASFWTANGSTSSHDRVLTSDFTDGLIFRTGGTTAAPKTSYITRAEFREGGQTFSRALVQAGLLPGDRVANLLYGGDLYKSFLDLSFGLMDVPISNVHLSIGGASSFENQGQTLHELSATVVVVMPTVASRLADYLVENDRQLTKSYPSKSIPPRTDWALVFGSVDAGIVGLPVGPPGQVDEKFATYAVNTPNVMMEIIADTGEVITEEERRGQVVVTNFMRRLMPTIRYPIGDIAEWVNYSERKFRFLGREAIGARVGMVSYDLTKRMVISNVLKDDAVSGFQVLVRRSNLRDEMVFRIASKPQSSDETAEAIKEEMNRTHNVWAEEVRDGNTNPLVVEWVPIQDLHVHARTGKLREIVDVRYEGLSQSR